MIVRDVCLRLIHGVKEDENHIFLRCQHAENLRYWVSEVIVLANFDRSVGALVQ